MRGMFSLVAILVTVGLMMYLFAEHTATISKTRNEILPQVNQFSGRDADTGDAAYTTAVMEPVETNAKLMAVRVAKVSPGGAYEKYFGLMVGDTITSVEYQAVQTPLRGKDLEDARLEVFSAFQRQGSLTVLRNNQQMILPANGSDSKNPLSSLQQQINAVQH